MGRILAWVLVGCALAGAAWLALPASEPEVPEAEAPLRTPARSPAETVLRGRAPVAVARVRGLEEDLARAVALLEGGTPRRRRRSSARGRGQRPTRSWRPAGPRSSPGEAALRAAREAEEKVRRLAGLVAERPERAREILAGVKDPAERERLARHLDRFVRRSRRRPGPAPPGRGSRSPRPQGRRRAGRKRRARRRPRRSRSPTPRPWKRVGWSRSSGSPPASASGLLQPVAAALDWLALHQGEDGRFSTAAAEERCKVARPRLRLRELRAGPGRGSYDVAETALAVLAFLDFRDQDAARGLRAGPGSGRRLAPRAA